VGDALQYLAAADKVAGEVVVVGTRPLIVAADIDFSVNPLGAVYAEGVFDIPQAGEVITGGDVVYWDENGTPAVLGTALSGAATASTGGNYIIGKATPVQPNGTAATAIGDKYVRVKLGSMSINVATVGGSAWTCGRRDLREVALQRDGPHVRGPVDTLVRQALERAGIAYRVVYGQGHQRLNNALLALGLPGEDDAARTTRENAQFAINEGRTVWQCNECSDPECEHKLFTGLLAKRSD
jgi:predicted RecA/RadA family phage recombinase